MSDNFAVAATPQAHNADIEYFVRRGMTKGYQLMSVVTPIVYTVFATTRYGRAHMNVNRLLRATWMGGSLGESSYSASSRETSCLCRHHGRWCIRVRSVGILKPRESSDPEVPHCIRRESQVPLMILRRYVTLSSLPDGFHSSRRPLNHRRDPVCGDHSSAVLEAGQQHQP